MRRQIRQIRPRIRLTGLATALALVVVFLSPLRLQAAEGKGLDSQLEFGIQMAKRGLWNEALFRFSRVLEQRPGDPHVLNNMAVAYEAIGQFDKALEVYKQALERDSSNRELRRNYAQFVEFYQGLKPQEDTQGDPGSGKTDPEGGEPEGGDSGS